MCGAGTDDVRVVFIAEAGKKRRAARACIRAIRISRLLGQNKTEQKRPQRKRGSTAVPRANTIHTHLTHDTPHADAAVPEEPVPRRFRDASRTPLSSTTNGAAPTALTELFASVADRFPDASLESISRSSQAWDQASPKAGPGLSEVRLEAN